MRDKVFSLKEASNLLPLLRKLLSKAHVVWERLQQMQPEIQGVSENAQYNRGSFLGTEYVGEILNLQEILLAASRRGVIVKDVEAGLCDFPYEHEGRIVYLCWKLGEDKIKWWHEVAEGFAGRQPLEEPHES
ncbi:MAG: DUF2203 domain-containing protein [Acidobacteria bacterium]|nr:DUF2203 domain-containing protein [Acidobacteriota bacterium]